MMRLREIIKSKLYQMTRGRPFYFLKIKNWRWVILEKRGESYHLVYNQMFTSREDAAQYFVNTYNNGALKTVYKRRKRGQKRVKRYYCLDTQLKE